MLHCIKIHICARSRYSYYLDILKRKPMIKYEYATQEEITYTNRQLELWQSLNWKRCLCGWMTNTTFLRYHFHQRYNLMFFFISMMNILFFCVPAQSLADKSVIINILVLVYLKKLTSLWLIWQRKCNLIVDVFLSNAFISQLSPLRVPNII